MDASHSASSPASRRWIVGYDGSENARHASAWAIRHAPGRADLVDLFTAWQVPTDAYLPAPGGYISSLPEDLEAAAQHQLDALTEAIRPTAQVALETTVTFGGAARCLLDAAPSSDLVVVGSRGRGGFARLLLGSTSTQVATHAAAPTAVVPLEAQIEAADRILVAVDGSPNSLAAADWALHFAAAGTTVTSVFVRDVPHVADVPTQVLRDADDDAVIGTTLQQRRDRHGLDHVRVAHEFVDGSPRQELRRLAADADLVVMGARGHGAIGSALLGSVSTWLLHHLDVPMVVVPAADTTD